MVIAALVGSNLATASVLYMVSRRANTLEQRLAKLSAPTQNQPELVFIEGAGTSLLQRETMRASAIAARNRMMASHAPLPSDPTLTSDPAAPTPPLALATQPTTRSDHPSPDAPAPTSARLVPLLVAFDLASQGKGPHATLDAQLSLIDDAATLSATERVAVADKLRSLSADGRIPALFLIARLHEQAGEPNDAARWYLTANIVRIIDVRRFKQLPESKTTLRVTQLFNEVQQRLRENSSLRRSAVEFALDLEDAIAERPAAAWLLDGAAPAPEELMRLCLSDEAWREARQAVRASLVSALKDNVSDGSPQPASQAEPASQHTLLLRHELFGETLQTLHSSHATLATQPDDAADNE